MKYVIKGDPIAWARAGLHGKRVYDTQKHQKLVAGITLRDQHQGRPMYQGPLSLDVTFYLKIPQRRNDNWDNKPHYSPPDFSNLLKFIEDIGTGLLYEDDRLISHVSGKKVYGIEPRTEFTIMELNGQTEG